MLAIAILPVGSSGMWLGVVQTWYKRLMLVTGMLWWGENDSIVFGIDSKAHFTTNHVKVSGRQESCVMRAHNL